MYIIHIDIDTNKLAESNITSEQFWKTAKLNMEENKFMQLEENKNWYVNWGQTATLGKVWALQYAWEDDLPEYAGAITKLDRTVLSLKMFTAGMNDSVYSIDFCTVYHIIFSFILSKKNSRIRNSCPIIRMNIPIHVMIH